MVFNTSARMIVSHILPDEVKGEPISDLILEKETNLCKEKGVEGYINLHNSQIDEAKAKKQKHFWRGYKKISLKALMAYFTRTEMTQLPITSITVA